MTSDNRLENRGGKTVPLFAHFEDIDQQRDILEIVLDQVAAEIRDED